MLRLALTPRWLGWLSLVAVACVAFLLLGQWQWDRYETKQARADRVEAHYTAPAVPVEEVLGQDPVPLDQEWRRVEATGTYDAAETVLARNRPHEDGYGSEVLVPLRLDDGRTLIVDRGWVANSPEGAEVRPDVPEPPTGEVEVTGWVRPGEPDLDRDMPDDLVASINLDQLADRVGGEVLGGYVIMQDEQLLGASDGAGAERPTPLEEPDTGIGPHLAYAIQWWLGIPAAIAFVLVALRREARVEAGLPAREPKPKKVRIWDEEDG